MKRFLIITLMAIFVVACGGGDDGNASAENTVVVPPVVNDLTKEEIEVKFNLPAEPDPAVNNATIEGVDSNGVRGRDDVERALTFKHYKDEEKLNHLYSLLEAEREISIAFQGKDETERQNALNEISRLNMCYTFSYRLKGAGELKKMYFMLENTNERLVFNLGVKGDRGGSFKEVIKDCKKRGFTNMPL